MNDFEKALVALLEQAALSLSSQALTLVMTHLTTVISKSAQSGTQK